MELELSPIFSSSRVTANPGASERTRNALARSPSFAKTMKVEANEPLVIHCLAPVILSSATRVRMALASDPLPDSVSANAASSSPAASGGTRRAICSSLPWLMIGSVPALVWTATVTPTPASARLSSSSTRMYVRKSVPAPPNSSGTHTPISPSSPSSVNNSRGKWWSRSHCAAFGATFSSAKRLARSRISRWSSVSS